MVDEPTVIVGVVTKAHGVRGDVVVQNRSDNPDRWRPGSVVFLARRPLTVRGIRGRAGGRLIVRFEEVADRDEAERLRGELTVPAAWLPELPPGEWWPRDLLGCEVRTESGRSLGRLADVVANPANDLWVAADEAGRETIVPALRDLLVDVDVVAKRIVVRDVPGLTAPDDEPGRTNPDGEGTRP